MSKQFYFKQFNLAYTLFSSIWLIERTLSGTTTQDQSGSGYNGNKEVFSITGASPSDCSVSYPGHSLAGVGFYLCTEMHSVYSAAPADWAINEDFFTFLPIYISNS